MRRLIIILFTQIIALNANCQSNWFFVVADTSSPSSSFEYFNDGDNLFVTFEGQSNSVGRGYVPSLPQYLLDYDYTNTYTLDTNGAGVASFDLMVLSDNHNGLGTQGNSLPANSYEHGSELSFAYNFEQDYPNSKLYILKLGYGGTSLNIQDGLDHAVASTNELHKKWRNYVDTAKILFIENDVFIKYSVYAWHQGETDSDSLTWSMNYDDNLTNKFNSIDLYYPYDIYIINRLPSWSREAIYLDTVMQALEYVANTRSYYYWIDNDNYGFNTNDTVHINSAGQVQKGEDEFLIFKNSF